MSSQPGCVSEWGTRFRAHNCCLLTQAVCESRPAAVRLRFTGSVTPARANSSAVAHKPHVQAQRPVESIRVQITIYRPRKCFTRAQARTNAVAGWMRSWPSWVGEMQGAWTCWSIEVFSRKGAFPPPQFLRKGAQWCVFIDPYLHWAVYRHNETWWSEESAIFFHRQFRLNVRSIRTQGRQRMGKMYGVGEEGEIPKEKSGVLDFNAWISLWTTLHYVRQGSLGSVSKAGGWNQRTFS